MEGAFEWGPHVVTKRHFKLSEFPLSGTLFSQEEPVPHVVQTSAGFWGLVGRGLHMLFALSPSAWPEATKPGVIPDALFSMCKS